MTQHKNNNAAVLAVIGACACLVLVGVILNSTTANNNNNNGATAVNELLDPNLGSSGSGLDFGLDIPKPTLSSSQVKRLVKYENTRKKLLNVVRKLEQRLAGVQRPLVEIRVATPGQKGAVGPIGPAGKTGPEGVQGNAGPPGPMGIVGKQGHAGAPGVQGPPGPPGEPGRRGSPGPDGQRGPRGQRGRRGAMGHVGLPGRAGPAGSQGKPGARGDMGPRGHQGHRGAPGLPGPVGKPPLKPGTVQGSIVNIMDGKALTGVSLKVLKHKRIVRILDVTPTGEYASKMDPGQYTLQATAPGFLRARRSITVSSGVTQDARLFLTPAMPTGELRIALTWNKRISDMDLHMETPAKCIVGWQHKECKSATGEAKMVLDDTSGQGPETIAITKLEKGTYKLWVHRYSSGNILTSEATVRVYFPSGKVRVYNIGTDGSLAKSGDKWHVATIDGTTGTIYGPVMQGTKWVSIAGSPATFSSISTSQSGLNVWAVSNGVVYRRQGITDAKKEGTKWEVVTGVPAVGVAASDLGVWVWDSTGHINARLGVTAQSGQGTSWLPVPPPPGSLRSVSFDGANAVATTADGRLWWRAGIVATTPAGTRWFQVPGHMSSASVYSNVLWACHHGKIYRRVHMASAPPAGTGWERVPGVAKKVSVSNGVVWVVTGRGLVFYRKGLSKLNRNGSAWGQLESTKRIFSLSAGNGVVWALDKDKTPVFRKGVSQTGYE